MTITILLSGKQDKVTAIALAVATLVPKAVSERESNKTDAQYTNDLLDQIADEVSEMGLGEYATERLMDIIGSYKEECDPDELDHMVEEAEYAATVSEMRDIIDSQEKRIKGFPETIRTLRQNHNNDIRYIAEQTYDVTPSPDAFRKIVLQCLWNGEVEDTSQTTRPHPDDVAVDNFAIAMKKRLAEKRAEGRGGWEVDTDQNLSSLLMDQIRQGDPLDAGSFCCFLFNNNQQIVLEEVSADNDEPETQGSLKTHVTLFYE